jgi:hypothetical protein
LPPLFHKLNFDGASKGNSSHGELRGVLWDEIG